MRGEVGKETPNKRWLWLIFMTSHMTLSVSPTWRLYIDNDQISITLVYNLSIRCLSQMYLKLTSWLLATRPGGSVSIMSTVTTPQFLNYNKFLIFFIFWNLSCVFYFVRNSVKTNKKLTLIKAVFRLLRLFALEWQW